MQRLAGDVLIVASNSGRNAVPVEMALEGRARGLRVIAITNLAHARQWGQDSLSVERVLTTVTTSFERFGAVAQHEAALQKQLVDPPAVVVTVANRPDDIADASGLAWIANYLFAESEMTT